MDLGQGGEDALLAAVVVGSETVRGVNTVTLRQEVTPDHMLGRVTASFWTTLNVPGALGAWARGSTSLLVQNQDSSQPPLAPCTTMPNRLTEQALRDSRSFGVRRIPRLLAAPSEAFLTHPRALLGWCKW